MITDVEDVLTHGISEKRVAKDAVDLHLEEIDYLGFTVVESGLSETDLETIRGGIDRAQAEQVRATEGVGAAMKSDADILRCPLAYDEIFLRVATVESLMEICRRVLGQNFVLLQQNAIVNCPTTTEYQSRWHRDLSYQHFVSTRKLALNALLCVEDFTIETGGTVVLPGSHMFEAFPSAQFVKKNSITATAKAGSILILDAMLFHRSGLNKSGKNRRGVNHLIGKPLLVQQIDIPRLLGGRHSSDPFLKRYLGYQWNPASDVASWRMLRA
jgi:ectoine hydroxylase-related dioxygenase (phytanoyl-CoA dioxygenase family)